MKSWISLCCLSALMLAGYDAAAGQPWVTKLRVPLEIYPSGQVKTQVTAARAQVGEAGDINAEGVRIEMYAEDGTVQAVVTTDACMYNKEKELVKSDSRVEFERDGIRVSGKGFRWRAGDETLTIEKDSRVEFQRAAIEKWRKSGH